MSSHTAFSKELCEIILHVIQPPRACMRRMFVRYGVTLGGTLGHALCTGLAVVGGRMLAAKISEKTVATIGGITFLAFAAHSFLFHDAFN